MAAHMVASAPPLAIFTSLRRAAALLAGGCILLQQGQDVEAKQRLSKALKLAHGPLASHQLVAQACAPSSSVLAADGKASSSTALNRAPVRTD